MRKGLFIGCCIFIAVTPGELYLLPGQRLFQLVSIQIPTSIVVDKGMPEDQLLNLTVEHGLMKMKMKMG